MATNLTSEAELIEEEIMRRAADSGVRLRFDKIALRLLKGVKIAVSETLPANQSVAFTVTAPIRLPAKTSAALQTWLRRLGTQESGTTIDGNKVRARTINNIAESMPRVIGFVLCERYPGVHATAPERRKHRIGLGPDPALTGLLHTGRLVRTYAFSRPPRRLSIASTQRRSSGSS